MGLKVFLVKEESLRTNCEETHTETVTSCANVRFGNGKQNIRNMRRNFSNFESKLVRW